jgi:hypothetical protein
VRYCGIDVSADPARQELVTLHERRSVDGLELVGTFYRPGSVEEVRRTIEGFGRGQAVVGIGARPADWRVCDALLQRRGLPPAQETRTGRELLEALAPLGPYRPWPDDASEGRVDGAHGRVFETSPEAVFCTLIGHLPPPRATPYGMQQRIAALKLKGVVDPDGGLWHRTLSELDACAAAYTAYAVVVGTGSWHGDPAEGVIVLPSVALLEHYDQLPPPSREPLA